VFANEAIESAERLASHVAATLERGVRVPVVLAVQETTERDWTAHPATTGLGPIGHPKPQGLLGPAL
jgi:hypothetical protein